MNIEQRVCAMVADQMRFDCGSICSSTNIISDLGADSYDRIELVMDLEDEFNIVIADADADSFRTIKDIVDHVTKAAK